MRRPRQADSRCVVPLAAFGVLLVATVPACSKDVRETAKTVLSLQDGSMTALRERRGSGPFRTYAVPPGEMLRIVESVLRARTFAVFAEPRRGEVCGKEREGAATLDDTYAEAWRSAVIVFVHPVPDDERASKVEFHATQRGAFTKGNIRWETELPPALDEAVRTRVAPIRPLR